MQICVCSCWLGMYFLFLWNMMLCSQVAYMLCRFLGRCRISQTAAGTYFGPKSGFIWGICWNRLKCSQIFWYEGEPWSNWANEDLKFDLWFLLLLNRYKNYSQVLTQESRGNIDSILVLSVVICCFWGEKNSLSSFSFRRRAWKAGVGRKPTHWWI